MNKSIDYITVIEPLLEVTLTGIADFYPWQQYLTQQGIDIAGNYKSATIILSATEGEFRGVKFREFSISLPIAKEEIFLVHAYNSRRLFAFAERRFFQTPYYFANIEIAPHRVAIRQQGNLVFKASLPVHAEVLSDEEECNQWKICLPKDLRRQPDQPHYFHARLEGQTKHYPSADVKIQYPHPSPDPILTLLADSNFQPKDWLVRPQARHSKSKTLDT